MWTPGPPCSRAYLCQDCILRAIKGHQFDRDTNEPLLRLLRLCLLLHLLVWMLLACQLLLSRA